MRKRGGAMVLLIVLGVIFFHGEIASAGFTDWFGKITGRATSQDSNVTITIAGTNAVTIEVFNETLTGSAITPSSDTTKAISFTVRINDSDGASDINLTSVHVNVTKVGESARSNASCIDLSQSTTYTKNFSCTINMWYFDSSGIWNITVAAQDLGNGTLSQNFSAIFTYGTLQDIKIHPTQITFTTASQGAVNVTSNNDPTVVNNSGNYNFSGINITAYNLHGETNSSIYIAIANITVGNNTGSSLECDTSSNGNANATAMANATAVTIKHSILTRGNKTANNGSIGQEQVYYCFRTVPTGVQSQTYSTSYSGGAWIISANV